MPEPEPRPTSPAAVADRSLAPADDPVLFGLDLAGLAAHWSEAADRPPIGAEAMSGADLRAQRLGVSSIRLMEHAGTAVAAVARALVAADAERRPGDEVAGARPILILAGPGNNGGDGFVAARRLSRLGHSVIVVLVAARERPGTPDACRNWDRLASEANVERLHAATPRDVAVLGDGIERAACVVDALLGTGVRGPLREPVASAVVLANWARALGVPVLAVDTPTAVDLTSGEPSHPVVGATATVTFHRPKVGLRTRTGARLAGRVLVAPIGIPAAADGA